VVAEHATKIYAAAISGIVIIVAFLALTSTGHVIDAATQHFMLYYAGVFALIALCTAVAFGLVATDRMILNPGHRIFIQSAHRAASFGALAFLVIHIVTEILAQRVHVLDAFVPFLSPFRTFYIGLGTIASDLILLLVITGILRKRFTVNGNAWKWRAIHYTSYVAFVFGIWHGLLGGRPAKPYYDWTYGVIVALVAVGLAVRILANSLRPKENLSAPPVPESASAGSGPMRAASMFAQLGMARAASQNALRAQSGPQPMLSAPVGDWNARSGTGPRSAMAALPAGPDQYGDGRGRYDGPGQHDGQQPLYEPGYEGPPRYLGAPRSGNTGPQPRLSGPMPRSATGSHPQVTAGGPQPRATGAQPRPATGPMPRATGPATGPAPRPGTGSHQRPPTGPMPRPATGPHPRPATGPMPRPASGPQPRPATGPRPGTGPRPAMGPMPPATGPRTGAQPRPATGPMPAAPGGRPRAAGPSGGRDGAPPRGRQQGDDPRRGGRRRAQGQPPRGAAGWAGSDDTGVDWNYDLPPWDGGSPEPDQNFRYREPGPGMPGYGRSRDPYRRGGDDQR
jgi:DMSO/TMAO reductase YedYZ heme-binding membrane subunit